MLQALWVVAACAGPMIEIQSCYLGLQVKYNFLPITESRLNVLDIKSRYSHPPRRKAPKLTTSFCTGLTNTGAVALAP